MATPSRRIVKTIEPDDGNTLPALNDLFAPETPEPLPADIAFANVLSDLGDSDDSGKVRAYKLKGGDITQQVLLFECLPAEYSETMLQDPAYHEDGHHSFKVVLRGKGGVGIAAAKRVEVMPRKGQPAQHAASAPLDVAAITAPIMQAIAAQNEQTNKLIAALAQRPEVPVKTTSDILNEMLLMKQIIGGDSRNQPAQPNPIELMRSVVELSREIAQPEGGATNADVMVKLMEKFGGPILEAVATNQAHAAMSASALVAPRPTPQPMPQPMLQPQPQQPPAQPIAPTTEGTEDMGFMLDSAVKFLIRQAAGGADPELYAEVVLDNAGDDIASLLNLPNWFDILTQRYPDAAIHREWFTQLRDAVLRMLTDDAGDATSSGNPSTETTNAPDNSNNGPTTGTP